MTTEEKLQHFYDVSMESAREEDRRHLKNIEGHLMICLKNIKKKKKKVPSFV